ncbi:MAG: hypothetical protein [Arizlama microvirus]|nr:MAG: hypothetical protein [Arizlama microvirus]
MNLILYYQLRAIAWLEDLSLIELLLSNMEVSKWKELR